MVTSISLHPEVLWAQRNDRLFVTVNLFDAQNEQVQVEKDKLVVTAQGGSDATQQYAVEMNFFKEIKPEDSKFVKTGRGINFVLIKAEDGPYWPRLLTKESGKPHWLKTDFGKWKDEDEDEDNVNLDNPFGGDMSSMMGGGMGGMDMASMMGGMGGAGGAGGMDFASMMGGMGGGAGGMGGFDMSKLAGMAGGMAGGDEEHGDSDDDEEEEMPALTEASA